MNNYPDNFIPVMRREVITIKCSACGFEWDSVIVTDMNTGDILDSECPECGVEIDD